ncbi:hypothetical protein ACFYY8_33605 [Streptosporangium sp. NPDC001559]|uniref:hypothetical protein n=1 Tax=Streptosporangium sp. NPDC001559 TaxID=3366187 RepID=UPI0036DFEADC
MSDPYLVAGPATMAGILHSPPQDLFTVWLADEGIDRTRGPRLTVWPDRSASYEVWDLDEEGARLERTHPESLTVATLPPISGAPA